MNLYRGIIEWSSDDVIWDFEAKDDAEAESNGSVSVSPKIPTVQDWKIDFRKIGEGSVRFIATRLEVESFIEKVVDQQVSKALEGQKDKMIKEIEELDYRDFEKGEQFVTKDEVITKIKQL